MRSNLWERDDQASEMAVVLESMQLGDRLECGSLGQGSENLHSTVNLGEITVGDHLRRLIADTKLESSRAPVDELDGALCLQTCNSGVSVLGDDITAVQEAGCHVLSVPGVALDHLVVWLEARHGHFVDRVGLVRCLGCRDDGCISDKREMDARVGNEVGLELVEIDIEGAVEAQGCGN